MPDALLNNRDARRLFLHRHQLLCRETGSGKGADLSGVLTDLGFVQVDSVNTLARAHDFILWSRRSRYQPEALNKLIASERNAFEHWTHDAAIIPMQFFPMWRLKFARDEARMKQRWSSWRRDGWASQFDEILGHVEKHGPTTSSDVRGDTPASSGGWWNWHPSKTALEFLWRSGRLAISHREGFRKFYDLTERVIPEPFQHSQMHEAEIIDWAMSASMDRLGFATHGELAAFFDIATREEAKQWCIEAKAAGRLVEIDVEMADGTLRRCYSTQALLNSVSDLPEPSSRVRILSPFDPALRDRARAEKLFGFYYRIEIFVPAPKRQYGYYVFPVMQGDRLIGRIDAKREDKKLVITAFWPEQNIKTGKNRITALQAELERIASFLKLTELSYLPDWLRN